MSHLLIAIINMSISASCVALIVIPVRFLLKKSPRKYSYMLWAVVFFRLIFPFSIKLPVSAVPVQPQPIPFDIAYADNPHIQSGLPVFDDTINTVIVNTLPTVAHENSLNPMQIILQIGAYLWLSGVIVLFLYTVISYIRLKSIVQFAFRTENNVYEISYTHTPFVLGFIRPKIYIPSGLKNKEKEYEYIIKHEQTHIKRLDYLIKPLAFFITVIHWFNPLAWISYALMVKDMEISADENVISLSPVDIRSDYSISLLTLSVKKYGLLSPLAFGEIGVKERVKNVLKFKKPAFWISGLAFIIVVAAVFLLIGNQLSGDNYNAIGLDKNDNSINNSETLPETTLSPSDKPNSETNILYENKNTETALTSELSTSESSPNQTTTSNGSASVVAGDTIKFGAYDWRVLDIQNGKALILSDRIIEQRAYNEEFVDTTWETCTLRKYLNNEFYNKFSTVDKARIAETRVVNSDNPWFGTEGGNDTTDKIFLLSINEVVKYFGDSGQLGNRLRDDVYLTIIDDQYNTARIAYGLSGAEDNWWLRSPGLLDHSSSINASASIVDIHGYIEIDGSTFGRNERNIRGIRPALWLNLE